MSCRIMKKLFSYKRKKRAQVIFDLKAHSQFGPWAGQDPGPFDRKVFVAGKKNLLSFFKTDRRVAHSANLHRIGPENNRAL